MKAIILESYGGPEVLKLASLSDPEPGPGEVRIRIKAAGVNPVDAKIRKGLLVTRLPNIFPIIPGYDAAGVVDAVGAGVSTFKPGDAVFAYCRKPVIQFGTYADFVCVPETSVAAKPARMDFLEAGSVPLAALTAWQCLFDAAGLKKGQTILIQAGAGGVGGFAIQFAKHAGARVIATASAKNHAYVKSLGADDVIDYTSVDFRAAVKRLAPGGVDVAYDTVGGDVQDQSGEVVKPGGVLVSILAYRNEAALQARGILTKYIFCMPQGEQLARIGALIDEGRVRSRIHSVLPLAEAARAQIQIETQHTVGKIVLTP